MKWLVGAASVAVIAATSYYLTAEYASYAAGVERNKAAAYTEDCYRRLDDLKSYRTGAGRHNPAVSEATANTLVGWCAEKNAEYAELARPYLSK